MKGSLEGFPVLLVGNKCDEESGKRQVSTKTGEALEVGLVFSLIRNRNDLLYFRKCGKHVKNAILEILRQSLKKYYESH